MDNNLINLTAEILKTKKNGVGNPNQSYRLECEICGGTGWEYTSKGVIRCGCKKQKIRNKKLSKIPDRFKNAKLENFQERKIEFRDSKSGCSVGGVFPKSFDPTQRYFMAGGLGLGKTHLLWAQYRFFVENDLPLYAEVESELLSKLQEQKYYDVMHFELETQDVHFFIDDLGTTKMTEDRSMLLYELIDMIYRNCQGLTITTNWKLGELEKHEKLGSLTTRITRRIKDMCTIVYF